MEVRPDTAGRVEATLFNILFSYFSTFLDFRGYPVPIFVLKKNQIKK